ncbi:uncharacterized protein LOC144135174 isoform X2 [Amblyomma americanum]
MVWDRLLVTFLTVLALTLRTSSAQGSSVGLPSSMGMGFNGGAAVKAVKGGGIYPIYPPTYPPYSYGFSLPFIARGMLTINYNRGGYIGGGSYEWDGQQQMQVPPIFGSTSQG